MTAFRVTIGERAYEGHYDSPTNAVFGAMRKDENCLCAERKVPSRWWETKTGKELHRLETGRVQSMLSAPLAIFVEEVKGRKITKKVERVA